MIKFTNRLNIKGAEKEFSRRHELALKKAGLAIGTNMNTLSPKPPIDTGNLRRSLSVFYKNDLIGSALGEGSPLARSQTGNDYPREDTITFVYNTDYAKRIHEYLQPYPSAQFDSAIGNKWVERHLSMDRKVFMNIYKKEME